MANNTIDFLTTGKGKIVSDDASQLLSNLSKGSQILQGLTQTFNIMGKDEAIKGQQAAIEGAQFENVKGESGKFLRNFVATKAKSDIASLNNAFSKNIANAKSPEEIREVLNGVQEQYKSSINTGLLQNREYATLYGQGVQDLLNKGEQIFIRETEKAVEQDFRKEHSALIGENITSLSSEGFKDETKFVADMDDSFSQLENRFGLDSAVRMFTDQVKASVFNMDQENLKAGSFEATIEALMNTKAGGLAKAALTGLKSAARDLDNQIQSLNNKQIARQNKLQLNGIKARVAQSALGDVLDPVTGDLMTQSQVLSRAVQEATIAGVDVDEVINTFKTMSGIKAGGDPSASQRLMENVAFMDSLEELQTSQDFHNASPEYRKSAVNLFNNMEKFTEGQERAYKAISTVFKDFRRDNITNSAYLSSMDALERSVRGYDERIQRAVDKKAQNPFMLPDERMLIDGEIERLSRLKANDMADLNQRKIYQQRMSNWMTQQQSRSINQEGSFVDSTGQNYEIIDPFNVEETRQALELSFDTQHRIILESLGISPSEFKLNPSTDTIVNPNNASEGTQNPSQETQTTENTSTPPNRADLDNLMSGL